QAVQALEKAKLLLGNDELSAESAPSIVSQLKESEAQQTQALLALKHKLDMSSAAAQQFETALKWLQSITGPVERASAAEKARNVM
ncbi:hypothetical protein HKB16_07395, partial [Vibrio parahaemolyticus]|nr:hypothetical protein [Vibrio parahaemolyticus]